MATKSTNCAFNFKELSERRLSHLLLRGGDPRCEEAPSLIDHDRRFGHRKHPVAKSLRENEDVKEFYLGLSSGERRSFRDVKHYRRRKRWLT